MDCSQVSDSEGVSQILVGTKKNYDFQTNDMLANTTEGEIYQHDATSKEIECKLPLGSKVEIQGQQKKLKNICI